LEKTVEPLKTEALHPKRGFLQKARVEIKGRSYGHYGHAEKPLHLVSKDLLPRATQPHKGDPGPALPDRPYHFFPLLGRKPPKEGGHGSGDL
jgi:hypothetical protein